MSTNRDFVHLHLHTDLSLLNASTQIKKLGPRLTELGMNACAITDQSNMYGTISFYNSMKANDIHPVLGYDAFLTLGDMTNTTQPLRAGERPYHPMVLLAESLEGYHNLAVLASKAFTEGFRYKPRIDIELLSKHSKGLIALSGGLNGAIAHFLDVGDYESARNHAAQMQDIFGKDNYFLEIQDHGLKAEKDYNQNAIKLGKELGIARVATNESFYLTKEDSRAHELLLCIGEGKTVNDPTHTQLGNSNFYVRSPEEMWKIFGDMPETLTITSEIAQRCQVKIPKPEDNYQLPNFPIPPESNCATDHEYFEKVVMDGFADRKRNQWDAAWEENVQKYQLEDYQKRVRIEIDIINDMGFPGYFLVVWDFIKYAREEGIPVGPGRGSAAGSLVAYCLGITDVDPIQYDLLFERFLNPERITMPDIDIDFCVKGRAQVIQHVTDLYGADKVCQIITFGTMASRAAIKDVGRALEMSYADVERVSKLIPPPIRGRNVSIDQAIQTVPELKGLIASDAKVKELVDLALRLEGCSRHSSVHAAGVVISPKPLHELIPVSLSSRNELTTQYAMGDLEKGTGMLKMDFLALTTLTIIEDCLQSIKAKVGDTIDWLQVPINDEKTMNLFGEGKTQAIFQFESSGMAEITRRLKPHSLEDLSALNALYRPGPLDGGMVEDYIDRHHGKKKIRYIVPQMEGILKNTYGVLVYQEQIMQLAQQLAGYSLGGADMMRRAMGKKKREEMAKHQEMFVDGCVERSIKKEKAEEIFHLMAQFADYGFNRSHSMAYAYVAFQTAYLKAHYPEYFYASVLSNEADDSAKIYQYSVELKSIGIKLLPPDVNESDLGFTPISGAVRFGLAAIKGIGTATVEAILRARAAGGKFTSIFDFTERIDQGAIGRRGMESLISAGAFDSMMPEDCPVNLWRAKMHAGVDMALSRAQKAWKDKESGQDDLFGMLEAASVEEQEELPDVSPWSSEKLAAEEKACIGFYLSCHPLENFSSLLGQLNVPKMAELPELQGGEIFTLAGLVSSVQVKPTKKGTLFARFKLEDESAGVRCNAWSESYGKYSQLLKNDQILLITGRIEGGDQAETTLVVDEVVSLVDAVPKRANRALISLPYASVDQPFLDDIFALLDRHKGKCKVYFSVQTPDEMSVDIAASEVLGVSGSKALEDELKQRNCQINWILN